MGSQSVAKLRSNRNKPQNVAADKGDKGGDNDGEARTNTTKIRRERNRQAQHIFRIRKQAEQQQKDQHIHKLESEIEQMGSVFYDLADAITRSEHAQADAQVMQTLRNSLKRVVRLGNENIKQHDSEDSDPSQTSSSASSDEHVPVESATTAKVPSSSEVDSPHSTLSSELQVCDYRANDDLGMLGSRMFNISPGYQPDMFIGTLSNRIIHESLRHGYMVLSKALDTSSEVQRLFQSMLQYGTREQTLTNIKWALGPGNWFIPMLASHNFYSEAARNVVNNILEQKSNESNKVDEIIDPATDPYRRAEICLNAVEVEKYIMSRSTGYINEDILELVLGDNNNNTSSESQQQQQQQSQTPQPEDWVDYNIFFPTEQRRMGEKTRRSSVTSQEPRIIRVSQSRLVRNIACLSICTPDGPGYRTEYLEKVIVSSAIKSY